MVIFHSPVISSHLLGNPRKTCCTNFELFLRITRPTSQYWMDHFANGINCSSRVNWQFMLKCTIFLFFYCGTTATKQLYLNITNVFQTNLYCFKNWKCFHRPSKQKKWKKQPKKNMTPLKWRKKQWIRFPLKTKKYKKNTIPKKGKKNKKKSVNNKKGKKKHPKKTQFP